MSTRSRIGMLNSDGTISSIYCHFDGYPSGVGQQLKINWTDINDIIELIANGDISSLGDNLDTTDFYNTSDCSAHISLSLQHYKILGHPFIEYHYLYKDGHWVCLESNKF